ncbi:MAG: DNA-processing protein DprA [Phycisphaeraceae bacterium]
MRTPRLDAMIALSLARGLGPTLTARAIDALGSPEAAAAASVSEFSRIEGFGRSTAQQVCDSLAEIRQKDWVEREWDLIQRFGVTLLLLEDDDYPALLRHIHDPPPLLYVRGRIVKQDALALAIVGARQCTGYGREQADRFAAVCSQAGLTIISGGAYGVDIAAHRAALRIGGRTIAVLGSGLAEPYPSQHIEVFDQIAGSTSDHDKGNGNGNASRGAVISELPMSTPPIPQNFPRRNRIISGLSLGVLVIEAANRSGALVTARVAAEEHHREVMALPGRVDSPLSAGCHRILREGWATLVTNAADVLDALGETGELLKAGMTTDEKGRAREESEASTLFAQVLSDSQKKIVDALSEPRGLDQLSAATGLAVHVIQADITMLQIRGMIRKEGAMFARK